MISGAISQEQKQLHSVARAADYDGEIRRNRPFRSVHRSTPIINLFCIEPRGERCDMNILS